jgi:hypothetical protein
VEVVVEVVVEVGADGGVAAPALAAPPARTAQSTATTLDMVAIAMKRPLRPIDIGNVFPNGRYDFD